jgi:hypothetical protein
MEQIPSSEGGSGWASQAHPDGSLPSSHEPATIPYLEPDEAKPHPQTQFT